jgi:hypothetical protein
LTPTEKAISNKSKVDFLFSTPEEDNKQMDKMLFDKIAEKVTERQNKNKVNENIPVEVRDFKSTDSELLNFSDAADYRLTDGMEDSMLSSSMNQAAALPNLSQASTSLDTIQDSYATGPELAMAKGGLVARRKK